MVIQNYYRTTILSLGAMLGVTAMVGGILASNRVLAEDDTSVVDEINITVPIACTMSGTRMNTHNANINNGLYVPDIGSTTLHAFCNDNEGFAIYAAGYTGNEVGGTNSNKLVGTTASGNATIESGIATTAGNPDISNWAMKLTMTQDSGDTTTDNAFTIDSAPNVALPSTAESGATQAPFSNYHVVPNEYTKVAHKNSGTDMTDTTGGVKLTTTYAAYISKTQPADTYTGQVKYTLVHPSDAEAPLSPQQATAGCINYFANASNAVGTMGCQSATDGNTITLLASNFSRTGYGFAGWSDKYDYATNQNAHFYGPQEDITVPIGTTANGLSLYAVWVPSVGSLQDSSKVSQLCGTGTGSLTTAPTDGTANLASVSALTDQRDNNTYAIAKLADGKCWMIENLRLESTAAHNFDGTLAQGYGTSITYGNFSGLADPESTGFSDTYSANSLYSNDGSNDTINIGTSDSLADRMPRYNNWNNQLTSAGRPQSPTTNDATNSTTKAGMYSYGNYYTWAAAIADTAYYETENGSVTNTSLCPTGWRLPQGGDKTRIEGSDDNDFWNLTVDALNSGTNPANYDSQIGPYYTGTAEAGPVAVKLRSYPNNFLYSSYFNSSFVWPGAANGLYWSSTVRYWDAGYYLSLGDSRVGPGTLYIVKHDGLSVRCMVSASS